MSVVGDQDRALLLRLAAQCNRRLGPNGRPVFNLTREEAARSTHQVMRLVGWEPKKEAV